MKVIYNITQNKFNAILNQETTEIKVSFKTGYYPLPVGLENYYTKNETYSQTEINGFLSEKQNTIGYTTENSANKSDSYTVSSSVTYASTKALVDGLANKLDKGTYTGTASDLLLNDQNLENSKQNKVTVIPITGNTTLSEIHNGAILHVTNTCNITIPTGLDVNFQCVVYAKGSIIVTFVNGGVTINSPSGLLLKTDKMASLFASASNTFNLLGELATS